jgi:hypothetical protein
MRQEGSVGFRQYFMVSSVLKGRLTCIQILDSQLALPKVFLLSSRMYNQWNPLVSFCRETDRFRAQEEGDAVTSSTTINAAIAVQPPCGRAAARTRIPFRVPGGAEASAALALLDDDTASPASRRLASARAARGTRPILILGQAPSYPEFAGISWHLWSMAACCRIRAASMVLNKAAAKCRAPRSWTSCRVSVGCIKLILSSARHGC